MTTATLDGTVIARSDDTIVVEGNHYFPPDSVDQSLLRDSDTTSRCPWKGLAQYKDVVVGDRVAADAAWYYPEPLPAASEITGYYAFWNGVVVEG
jgi:uncharacterized protein (DUF427 family)